MTKIFLKGQEIKFSDWYISFPTDNQLLLTVVYASGKKYSRPYQEWRIEPTIERVENAREESDKVITQNVVAQFGKIVPFEGTALNAYITKKLEGRKQPEYLIFPFGINATQMHAVKQAFSSQLSVIEGPPGTGKTQTKSQMPWSWRIFRKSFAKWKSIWHQEIS